jgi:uncharacterized membrane protein YagU involved in acid resistance
MIGRNVKNAIYAGLAAGLVFGIIMWQMGMLPAVAALIGQETPVMGFVVHMAISLLVAIGFGLVFGGLVQGVGSGIFWGMLYGAAWWVIGPLTLVPYIMGQGLGANWTVELATALFPSLIGHLVFGTVLGVVFGALRRAPVVPVVVETRTVIERTVTLP